MLTCGSRSSSNHLEARGGAGSQPQSLCCTEAWEQLPESHNFKPQILHRDPESPQAGRGQGQGALLHPSSGRWTFLCSWVDFLQDFTWRVYCSHLQMQFQPPLPDWWAKTPPLLHPLYLDWLLSLGDRKCACVHTRVSATLQLPSSQIQTTQITLDSFYQEWIKMFTGGKESSF